MVSDPLAWPWSTYRDVVGLSLAPLLPRAADVNRLHRYVSADPSTCVEGTLLPAGPVDTSRWALQAAVSELLRVPLAALGQRGPARTLWLQCALALHEGSRTQLALALGVDRSTLRRLPPLSPTTLDRVLRVAGDPRFPGL